MGRTFAAFDIDDDLKRAIEMCQEEVGATKSNIVRRALRSYLKIYLDQIFAEQKAAKRQPNPSTK